MLEVPKRDGSLSFQSNEVRGAQNSDVLFCNEWRISKALNHPTRARTLLKQAFSFTSVSLFTCHSRR